LLVDIVYVYRTDLGYIETRAALASAKIVSAWDCMINKLLRYRHFLID